MLNLSFFYYLLIEFLYSILNFLFILIPILLLIAFVTLLERKEIATMQKRRGPNIVGLFGLLQPFADGLKLILKEPVFPYASNKILFFISPLFTFFISLSSWAIIPLSNNCFIHFDFGILYILGLSSLSVYGIIISGWSSNSKYAFFGSLRSTAQMISYEISFSLALLPVIILSKSMNIEYIILSQNCVWFIFPLILPSFCAFISILAETNRTPFDLPEAEAELVSGYNVEYSAFMFAFFYLAEYLSIVLMSIIFVIFFLGGWFFFGFISYFIFSFKVLFVVYLIIWIRVTVPRYRFDQLLQLGWKVLLPITMAVFIYINSLCFFFISLVLFLI